MNKHIFIDRYFKIALLIGISLTCTSSNAAYYVDAINGNDLNSGSIESRWKSISKAIDTIKNEEVVYVYDGEYDRFEEFDNARTGILSFKAAENCKPIIKGLILSYSQLKDSFLKFYGIKFYTEDVNFVLKLDNISNVTIENSEISAKRWSLNSKTMVDGIQISNSSNILIQRNTINNTGRGLQIANSKNLQIINNFIAVKGGSAIQYLSGNNILINRNHITGEEYITYPSDPLAYDSPHQSAISIRGNEISITENIIHKIGTTSAIMTYEPDAAGGQLIYNDIEIRQNLIYNIFNPYGIRLYNLGRNISIIENTVFSNARTGECDGFTNDARYRYNTALAIHSLATGFDGSEIKLYNNIFIGASYVPSTIQEGNNIYWAISHGGTWRNFSPSEKSKVLVSSYLGCGNHPLVFEDGKSTFKKPINLKQLNLDPYQFLLSENSIAKNFGSTLYSSMKTLGTIGNDQILLDNGINRSTTDTSSGPYETNIKLLSPNINTIK